MDENAKNEYTTSFRSKTKIKYFTSIAGLNHKEVASALENVGTVGLSELTDFADIDFTENDDLTRSLWKQFLRFVQARTDNTIMGKAVKIMQCK